MGDSKISATVDFAAEGKQNGYLVIPHSRDESAWGSIQLPITVIKNGDGPTVLFTGGNHGDEYEGPIALVKARGELEASGIQGRVIIIPALNLPAFRDGRRTSPLDGGNMNRVFPGRRDGTITEMIAHFVSSQILPLCDAVIDIHSGGKTMDLSPCTVIHELEDSAQMADTLAALKAFGAPVGLIIEELDSAGMLDTAVEDLGKIFVSTELGGGGTTTPETVAMAERGVRNILKHFGILEGAPEWPDGESRLMHTPGEAFVAAAADGLFEMLVNVGDEVGAGDAVARIHFLEDADREPIVHRAPKPGTVLLRHVPGLIQKGDCVTLIAEDY